jgi:hypothetical protein
MSVKREILGSKKIRRSGRLNSRPITGFTDLANYKAGWPTLSRPFVDRSKKERLDI